MERRRSRLFTPLEWIGFWLRDYGAATAVVVGLFVLAAALLFFLGRSAEGPERFEQAQVVRFGYQETKVYHRPLVIVRTRDGALRELVATRQALRYCRRGDTIALVRQGSALFVHTEGCRGGRPGDSR